MQLTKNFTLAEFACKDGTAVPPRFYSNVTRLAQNLQNLRDYIGTAVVITGSGYRTAIHNKKVKGALHSQHLTASAADINVKGYTPDQLAVIIEKLISKGVMAEGGIGIYKTFLHYDIRGVKVRW
ncbi:peptidase M15 [Sphingobacterium spiritivorum ATCC 33300]|uniref:Peptidase M15 n=1 Tax=Sphingobacterium spiritivorum ATCC 33300 TaxID=525372 RepID=C2G3K7_SPHSI|nr:D-Ala-D-Ala carboxypeptidase family metallohydrolase [Sphingobacterium spiritivorum]EEI90212.1 peptidase M15 [Sphingobacterium spiritivorum ATCC 33300]QQS95153.1 hypothetical protein I6J03_17485 [Sphingobacterium spiritivorum]